MPAIVRYNPWSMLRDIQEEMNNVFNKNIDGKGTQWTPHVDITEESDKYRVLADLPGVKLEDIKLTVDDNVMTIKGERKAENKKENENYSRIERFSGSFYRQFSLPENADIKNIQAKCKQGVLDVVIPKKEPTTPKSLEIKIAEST